MNEELLAGLKAKLSLLVPETLYNQWFTQLEILSWDGPRLQLGVPNRFFKERIEAAYLEALEASASALAEGPVKVDLAVSPRLFSAFRKSRERDLAEAAKLSEAAKAEEGGFPPPAGGPASRSAPAGLELNPAFTFENFVAGSSNRLPHAVALQAAERPGDYACIHLCGQHGLGKTHLLQAVCRAARRERPGEPVLYTSSERFVADFVAAHAASRLREFRQLYRRLRILAFDDLQTLGTGNKAASQAELLRIMDDFSARGGQAIFSATLPPEELSGLEPRLRDRLAAGLVGRLELPDDEVRRELIVRKLRCRGIVLPAGALRMLTGELAGNVRRLEGTVNRLAALISIEGREPTPACLRAALEVSPAPARKSALTFGDVLEAVAEECGVTLEALVGRGRSAPVKRARQLAVILCRRLLGCRYSEMAQAFGGRGHATLIAIQKSAPPGLFSSGLEGRPVERVLFRLGLNIKPEEVLERQRSLFPPEP